MKLMIKPLSVNEAWKGRRYKTDKYDHYRNLVLYSLPRKMDIPDGPFCVACRWGLSSKNADTDNFLKPFIDCLQIKYGFNDKRIVQILAEKVHVKKGSEFIEFKVYAPIDFDSLELHTDIDIKNIPIQRRG